MRLILLMCSLQMVPMVSCQQVNSTRTRPLSPEEKLGNILISLAGNVQNISTCQEPIEEFEQQMRKTTMEFKGVNKMNQEKYREFLENVFNLKRNVEHSCNLFIGLAEDLITRIGSIERYIDKISGLSEQKSKRFLQVISKSFSNIAIKSVESLEEIKEVLREAEENLLSITKSSELLRATLVGIYSEGPSTLGLTTKTNKPKDREYKKQVKEQIRLFKEATEKSQIRHSMIEKVLILLEEHEEKIQESSQDLSKSNIMTTGDQWNLVLVKLQQARKVLDDFLNHIEKEDDTDLEKENGKAVRDEPGMKNEEVDD